MIRHAKSEYYLQKFANFRHNTKKVWEIIKEIENNKSKQSSMPQTINYNNSTYSSPQQIANTFNTYFSQIAPELHNKLPHTHLSHKSYLQGNFPQSMGIPLITINDSINAIRALKNKKCNIDEIPTKIIKEVKDVLAEPLTKLFNDSIIDGIFPSAFKTAKIIPIHKSGNKTNISNYRPISILPAFSKIFELIMKKILMCYLNKHNILCDRQFGFRPGLNTFDAVHKFTSDLYSALDEHKSILTVFVDFSKAFDTVHPKILLDKLFHYGIRGCVHKWFHSYLHGRSHYTTFDKARSDINPIHLGVPQGSILGPILFLLYINDMSSISTSLNTIQFADDSTLYMYDDNPTNLILKANTELDKFSKWCLANRLTINTSKTVYMLFTNTITKYQPLPKLSILNDHIMQVYKTKFLGITFDKNLTFKHHITNLCLKLSRSIALFLKIKSLVPIDIMKTMYYAHIFPHLSYCNSIWSTTYPCHLYNINTLHKKIVRIITNSDFLAHTPPIFKTLKILQLSDLSKFFIATHMYKHLPSTSTPSTLIHNHGTRNQHTLQIPRHNLTIYRHSLMYLGPITWNNIPEHIKLSPSLQCFKKRLKEHLLSFY